MSTLPELPLGFSAAGHACGIKSDPTTLDMALFLSDRPATAAGVFTQNRVCGAPVHVCRERLPRATARGVIINSGNSNSCTGERGIADAKWMTAEVASQVGCRGEDILVCSTGIIGRFLPKEKIAAGIPVVAKSLSPDPKSYHTAARGMMTTDTVPKQATRQVTIGGKSVRISGAAKGAAMIAPNMATMLCVVMTDAAIGESDIRPMLKAAVDRSFNCITIDGHTSTSDTVLLLANGASGASVSGGKDREAFQTALNEVCMELSQKIIRDGEGAQHFVTVDVQGLESLEAATTIARAVCDSALVKTAITGNDPNWGRIVSAAGYCGIPFAEHECSLTVNGFPLYLSGTPQAFDEKSVSDAMRTGEVHIILTFTRGTSAVRFWTTDLTAEYVRLNADYTT
jgi:glutamate N-acetyltransferase/amino-acid N-acetyltransferase